MGYLVLIFILGVLLDEGTIKVTISGRDLPMKTRSFAVPVAFHLVIMHFPWTLQELSAIAQTIPPRSSFIVED